MISAQSRTQPARSSTAPSRRSSVPGLIPRPGMTPFQGAFTPGSPQSGQNRSSSSRGPGSQAVVTGQLAKTSYVGGHNSVDADGKVVGSTVGEQASQALRNLATVPESEGRAWRTSCTGPSPWWTVTHWMRVSPPSSKHGTQPARRRPSRSTSSAASAPGSSWRSTPSLSCDGSRRLGSPLADRRYQDAGPEAGAPGTPGEPLGVRWSGDGRAGLAQVALFNAGQRPRTCPAAIRPSSNSAVPVVTTGSCAANSRSACPSSVSTTARP
jgi:enamine deaminase RidA (YjgF/YER057c/UK114 family)